MTWRTVVVLAAFSFGLYAQWLMWRAYQYAARLARHERQQIVQGNRLMGEAFKRGGANGE